MKPNWKDAPPWADYLAMDANGAWWWYERRPKTFYDDSPEWEPSGRSSPARIAGVRWKESLEQRPEVPSDE